jgi:hypothetical protein
LRESKQPKKIRAVAPKKTGDKPKPVFGKRRFQKPVQVDITEDEVEIGQSLEWGTDRTYQTDTPSEREEVTVTLSRSRAPRKRTQKKIFDL